MTTPLVNLSHLVPFGPLSAECRSAVVSLQPETSAALARVLYREWKNNPAAPSLLSELCNQALSSEFSLDEWCTQILRMYDWLKERGNTAHFCDVVQYVSCAFEGSCLQPGHNLDWYLETFGFDRCSPLMGGHEAA
jgi:hypothetical protein